MSKMDFRSHMNLARKGTAGRPGGSLLFLWVLKKRNFIAKQRMVDRRMKVEASIANGFFYWISCGVVG